MNLLFGLDETTGLKLNLPRLLNVKTMKLFDVYPLFDINIVKGKGCKVWDDKGNEYQDLYGGHAVISIGHSHPHYGDDYQTGW